MPAAKTRTESLRLKLEEEILTRRFVPGQKLDEEELAARFGMSRTPVREALKALTSSGLVEVKPHQGAYVATLTARVIIEMVETMAVFEVACASLAARRHTLDDQDRIKKALDACGISQSVRDPSQFYRANVIFHDAIYRASGNTFLASQAQALRQRLEPYRRQVAYHPGLIGKANEEHARIVVAIFAMDEIGAAEAMKSHIAALQDTIGSMVESTTVEPRGRRRAVG